MSIDAYARFLTARWDEQEAVLDAAGDTGYESGTCGIDVNWLPNGAPSGVEADVDYLLNDLAAKRAILDEVEGMKMAGWLVRSEPRALAERTLLLLAAPFRDHPDHPANQEA